MIRTVGWPAAGDESSHVVIRRRGVPPKFIVAGAVVLLAVVYLVVTSLSSATAYYLTVSELQAQLAQELSGASGTAGTTAASKRAVRVSGDVVPGSILREGATLRFTVADAGGSLPVVYRGVVPDIFGDNIQVVVEGQPGVGGAFEANTLLAKCPSKFEASPSAVSSTTLGAASAAGARRLA